jgi:hypothetical protein
MNRANAGAILDLLRLPNTGHIGKIAQTGARIVGYGAAVPADTTAGYEPGAIWVHTDGAAGAVLYVNEGTNTSCDFNAVTTPSNIATQFDTAFPVSGSAAGRGPSPLIWDTCPVLDYQLDPTKGMAYFNDLHFSHALAANQTKTYLAGGISGFTGATAGSTISSLISDPNGVLVLATTTDNESVGIQALGALDTAGQFVLTSGKKSWFEARIKVVNITDAKFGLFCGFAEEGLLAENGMIGDDDALPDKDYIGFFRVAADGDKLDTVHRKAAGAAVTVQADAVTMAADTWKKVGFYCDGTTVTFYADGVALATTCALATATVPTAEEMAFNFVLNAAHADDCSIQIDWVRVAREF